MARKINIGRRVVALILGTTMTTMVGCANLPQGVAPDAAMTGLADSGSLVRLTPEQELVIKLNANPATGYAWRIDQTIDRAVLLPDGNKMTQTSEQKSRQEEVVTQYLRFIGQQPGRTRLNLVYTNERQGLVEDTPKYSLEVIVAPRPESGK
ncbi:MAG: protease inhibitor I42 family protein [Phycisphaerales bacterium]|nr:protease inhibitor I42 family protein [Phycisphaerales bacterium]